MINTRINLTKNTLLNINEILYNLNMKARKIKKSYISCTGYFASYKNKTQVAFESVLERDFYMMLEFDDEVVKYEEQPLQINYEYFDGKTRRYTPDTLVTYKNGIQKLFEVKYENEIKSNIELQKKLELLRVKIKEEYNYDFEIFTDMMIDRIYLDNLKFLYKFAFISIDERRKDEIDVLLDSNSSIIVKDLLDLLTSNKTLQLEYIPYIWNYVFQNKMCINIFEKLTMKTQIIKVEKNG